MLGEYTTRATMDVDFVDLGYPAKYGKVFVLLRDYDMLEIDEIINREDLFESKKAEFIKKLKVFREKYNV